MFKYFLTDYRKLFRRRRVEHFRKIALVMHGATVARRVQSRTEIPRTVGKLDSIIFVCGTVVIDLYRYVSARSERAECVFGYLFDGFIQPYCLERRAVKERGAV